MKKTIVFLVLTLMLASCSEYQRLLKSTDYELKYNRAMEYYKAENYTRAATLFEELIGIYRGSDKAEIITYSYADALYRLKDYMMAAHYYQQLVRTYPASDYAEECQFMTAYCKYKLSPKPRLDQSYTRQSINDFQLFINMYPNSNRIAESTRLMDEMRDKLVYKSYLNAKLYFDLGTYRGNNYLSAVIAAQNSLKEFPDTKYREELSFLILEAKHIQAVKSIEEKQEDRARDAVDEYYSFINEFPESKHLKKAEQIYKESSALIKEEVN
ncbi:outer membrane protein assembly factor BamD [Breznakibacter xylanolyticus]|nr:outer membrane protein assembly factor BamD [Breznakibacter xylanolyticus]MBN2744909.1 outer membrane protein assembly factor BamD [Marinilabiliaceae bacterium]